ncbi:MAG: ABC transporter ATP-binding protein [Candidatus Omnitrophica bacterium]|nr:ABC transporter ATP-binding protein [Candidatus Omnitrophota bacterium]
MLKAFHLEKTYRQGSKELTVLKGVTLEVRRSEIVGIVGPSGAGKSTLLHILGGLDTPSRGEVFVDGECLTALDERRQARIRNKRFGFVFQFYHLLREFSALENVMLPAFVDQASLSVLQIRQKAERLLDFFGLSQRLKHRPSQLSGGEQQRVAVARALMNDPEVLFCDEPTGNLDFESGRHIQELLGRLNKEKGMTIVLVTHSPELAKGSHRVLKIFDGRIVTE